MTYLKFNDMGLLEIVRTQRGTGPAPTDGQLVDENAGNIMHIRCDAIFRLWYIQANGRHYSFPSRNEMNSRIRESDRKSTDNNMHT